MGKKIFCLIVGVIMLNTTVFASVIYLKTGQKVDAKIIKTTDNFVKAIVANDLTVIYFAEEIDHIDRADDVIAPVVDEVKIAAQKAAIRLEAIEDYQKTKREQLAAPQPQAAVPVVVKNNKKVETIMNEDMHISAKGAFERYLQDEHNATQKAKQPVYKYIDVKYVPCGSNVKITGNRYVEKRKDAKPFELLVGPDATGGWVVLSDTES